jgi:hypothetical protein
LTTGELSKLPELSAARSTTVGAPLDAARSWTDVADTEFQTPWDCAAPAWQAVSAPFELGTGSKSTLKLWDIAGKDNDAVARETRSLRTGRPPQPVGCSAREIVDATPQG